MTHYGWPMIESGEYMGFTIGYVGPERHPAGIIYRPWWRRISTGKERVGNILQDTEEQAIQAAMDCVEYILGVGKYADWPLDSSVQTADDYPLRILPEKMERAGQ